MTLFFQLNMYKLYYCSIQCLGTTCTLISRLYQISISNINLCCNMPLCCLLHGYDFLDVSLLFSHLGCLIDSHPILAGTPSREIHAGPCTGMYFPSIHHSFCSVLSLFLQTRCAYFFCLCFSCMICYH